MSDSIVAQRMEKTIKLEVNLILPNLKEENDQCLNQLEKILQGRKGILRAHIKRDHNPIQLCLHYDPNLLSIEAIRRIAEQAGTKITNRYHHITIPIEGMECSDCALVIEHSIGRMKGVLVASVNYATQQLQVEYDRKRIDRSAVEKRIRSLGYEIPLEGLRSWYQIHRELLFSILCGVFLLLGWLSARFLPISESIKSLVYIPAYLLGGYFSARHAWHTLKDRHLDTNLLMVIVALGAAAIGDFIEGALLLFLFSMGHALEERTLNRARAAIRALTEFTPKTCLVRRDSKEIEIPIDQINLNDQVIILPGKRVPVDGTIVLGTSTVDQSPITGESIPVEKSNGAKVFAGSVNGEGALEVRVTRLARDSTIARILRLVEEAQGQKSLTQQAIEKFERIFVPAILLFAILMISIPPLFGVPFEKSFLRTMSLLVATSPCALALATPSAILAGVAQAARHGVLVKGGIHLENLGKTVAIAFDKTGTITRGELSVSDLISNNPSNPLDNNTLKASLSSKELLALSAAVESRSTHPIAQAIITAAKAQACVLPEVSEVESIDGQGLRACWEGKTVLIGNQKIFEENKIIGLNNYQQQIEGFKRAGKILIFIAINQTLMGIISLANTPRPGIARVLQALKQIGIEKTIILTGDHSQAAEKIAKQLRLSDFRANLMPEDKLAAIKKLKKEYQYVVMVGDGVNDAPALANATVGIAIGGAKTEVALETADVALLGDDLSKLPFAIGLGRATKAIIQQNLAIAIGTIAALAIASLSGWIGIGLAIFFHEGSTILVVINALRLLRYRESI